MDDLRRRFASLDRLPAPDLWDTIELRAAAHDPVARVTAVVTPLPMRSRRSTRRSLVLLAAIVALLVALVAGALAIGSRRPPLPAIVTVPSASASIPSASATPGASPSPSSSASTATTPWMTGQELMGALSATYGYRWSPIVDHDSTVTSFSSDPVSVEAPFDGPAKVRVAADTNAVAGAGLQAGRMAQALAPDAAPWIQEAITQGVGADWGSFATGPTAFINTSVWREKVMVTASGGQVRVAFADPPVLGHYLDVTFLFPPPTPRLELSGSGVVLYPDAGDIWAVNPDGTNPHLLLNGVAAPLWWSADGSRLFYNDASEAIDTDGSPPVRIGNRRDNPRCPAVVADDNCEADKDLAVSPDGSRLAYAIVEGRSLDISTIVILDVATGAITRLASTRMENGGQDAPCNGGNENPGWSPDGTHLVFARGGVAPQVDGRCQDAPFLFTVRADGSELRRFAIPDATEVVHPQWSPDGSSILFNLTWLGTGPDAFAKGPAVFVIGSDGSDLRALTSDGRSADPHWTRDGRIVFIRWEAGPAGAAAKIGRGDVRIMDADGQHASTLDTTVPAQTAAGCLVCPYPDEQGFLVAEGHDVKYRFWQPMPARQP